MQKPKALHAGDKVAVVSLSRGLLGEAPFMHKYALAKERMETLYGNDKGSIQRDKDVWVRLELQDELYVGYCCPLNGQATNETLSENDIRTILSVEPLISNWWAYTEEIIEASTGECPNFKQHNNGHYALLSQ